MEYFVSHVKLSCCVNYCNVAEDGGGVVHSNYCMNWT